ncbi:enoyl-CoA hydratase/isomerase family protein [Marinifilum sp. RC60d5]|uniref:enoyl-CoA hydratase/isomerase family protein n=1 Tax=Marinifilum sp. RC60d5 TaxID=3458414 RepID=UPI004036AD7D
MKTEINTKYFYSELNEGTLVLYLNYSLILEQETFDHRNQLLSFLDEVNENQDVKVLVIRNNHPDFNLDKYKEKWNALYEASNYEGNILRVFRTFNQLLLKIKSMHKIVFSVYSKPVSAMLFSLSMAADLRFVSRDFYIDNDNYNFVNIPKGGATFVESNLMYVNPVKMLFQSDKVHSSDLLQKHIIDEAYNQEELKERVLKLAERYSRFDYIEFEAVKIVQQSRIQKLDICLQEENDYLLTCIRKKKNLNDRKISRIK